MPNRVPDLLATWREALRLLDAGAPGVEGSELRELVEQLRATYQRLTDQHASQTAAMQAEATDLIARTRSLMGTMSPDAHGPESHTTS